MKQTCADLLGEYRALADLCETLAPAQWQAKTDFYDWTPWDEIAHLAFFDETALLSARNPEAFTASREQLEAQVASGEISAIARGRFGGTPGPALLALWRRLFESLVAALEPLDPKTRLLWYGPTMSARSFATARLMETWAHGQDIWDMLGRTRGTSPGLRHIAHLGVTTYGWTFVNRGLAVPQPTPYVELEAPDGGRWIWGEPSATDFLRGPAVDFALLVTQRRHRNDTALNWNGEGAERWTLIARFFAGPPADGPGPGVRGRKR
jgi:uncharacterized protein (TIGR03084 family)